MKKMILLFFVLLAVTFLSSTVMAGTIQIPTEKIITEIHSYANGATLIYSPASADGNGCSGPLASSAVHLDWSTDPNMKAFFALALTAYVEGKTVGFGVNGCASGYGGEIPKAYRIDVAE